MGVIVVTSEPNMGEFGMRTKIEGGVLPFVIFLTSNGIHYFDRVPVSVGIVDQNEGYAS